MDVRSFGVTAAALNGELMIRRKGVKSAGDLQIHRIQTGHWDDGLTVHFAA